MAKILKGRPKKLEFKGIQQPKFSNQNLAYFQAGGKDIAEFSEILSPICINMHDNASTNKLSFSEFKISGLEDSLVTTLRTDGKVLSDSYL